MKWQHLRKFRKLRLLFIKGIKAISIKNPLLVLFILEFFSRNDNSFLCHSFQENCRGKNKHNPLKLSAGPTTVSIQPREFTRDTECFEVPEILPFFSFSGKTSVYSVREKSCIDMAFLKYNSNIFTKGGNLPRGKNCKDSFLSSYVPWDPLLYEPRGGFYAMQPLNKKPKMTKIAGRKHIKRGPQKTPPRLDFMFNLTSDIINCSNYSWEHFLLFMSLPHFLNKGW